MAIRPFVAFIGAALLLVALLNISKISEVVWSKNGGFTEWSAWLPCPITCGGGRTARVRNCTNPKPSKWGSKCTVLGPSYEVKLCGQDPCPINAMPGSWQEWSACDQKCGSGHMTRKRVCDSPKAEFGGKECRLEYLDEQGPCLNLPPCPIDGKWSGYGDFTACSVTCGKGTHKKTRACNNPAPQNGGKVCPNEPTEVIEECILKECNATMTSTTTATTTVAKKVRR